MNHQDIKEFTKETVRLTLVCGQDLVGMLGTFSVTPLGRSAEFREGYNAAIRDAVRVLDDVPATVARRLDEQP